MKYKKPNAVLRKGTVKIQITEENKKVLRVFSCDPPCQ